MSNKRKRAGSKMGAASRQLLRLAGNPTSIDEAIYLLGNEYLRDVPCPPTHLETIARRTRVTEIVAEDLPVSGELRRNGKNFKIVYSSLLQEPKRRFTVAHELAHAIFETTSIRTPRSGTELEKICDMIASELLMPRDKFLSLAQGITSVKRILELTQIFKTSLVATSIRYATLKKVSVFYLNGGNVAWGSGTIRKGPIDSLDYALRIALSNSVDKPSIKTVLLSTPEWTGEWYLEHSPLQNRKNALCMLWPNQQNGASSSAWQYDVSIERNSSLHLAMNEYSSLYSSETDDPPISEARNP